MAGDEPNTQAPNSPTTGGRGALAEVVGSMWSALVLGLLAAIFAWFWFGGSDDTEDPEEAVVVPGAAEPRTEPVRSEVDVGDRLQQQDKRAEAAPVSAEKAAAEHLLKTKETTVCQAKNNYQNQTDQLDMGQREKQDLCYENQETMGNFDTLAETSVAYHLDSELEVVFPPSEGQSDCHEPMLDSLTVQATQRAQQALLGAFSTAEGEKSNVHVTLLDDEVLQSSQDFVETFTNTEATDSSAQEAVLEANAIQCSMPEAVLGNFTFPEKSIVHKDVSVVSPTAIATAPLLLNETVAAQFIVQKDDLAVEAEQFSGLKREMADAAHAVLQENVLATKARLDAEVACTTVLEDGLNPETEYGVVLETGLNTKAAKCNAYEYEPPIKVPHAILQEDGLDAEAARVVHKDGLGAEVSHTTIQEDGLEVKMIYTTGQKDGLNAKAADTVLHEDILDIKVGPSVQEDALDTEKKHMMVQEDILDSETPYSTMLEDGLNVEVAHATVFNATETHTTLEERRLDIEATHMRLQEDGLDAKAVQASIKEAFPEFSPYAKAIQSISASSKEQELLVHKISQKLDYINGHEVISHLAGCQTSEDEGLPTDSSATKEFAVLHNFSHVSAENSHQLYKCESQPKNDSDLKMRKIAAVTPMPQYVIVKFRVHYITHSESQLIAVTGNHESLGEWNIYVPLKPDKDGFWSDFVLLPVDSNIEWKFVMVENGKIKRWEECNNRYLKTGHDDTEAHQWWGYH